MEPLSGLLVVAGIAGVTKAFSANTDRIIAAFQEKPRCDNEQAPNRIVIIERPPYDKTAAEAMNLDK